MTFEYAGISASDIEDWSYDKIDFMLDKLLEIKKKEKAEINRINKGKK